MDSTDSKIFILFHKGIDSDDEIKNRYFVIQGLNRAPPAVLDCFVRNETGRASSTPEGDKLGMACSHQRAGESRGTIRKAPSLHSNRALEYGSSSWT